MSDNDGIDEALEGQVRLALISGARIGSEIAAAWAARMREAQQRDEQATRELEVRHAAERRVAVAELVQVYRPGWWEQADADAVGQAYQIATAWEHESVEAAAAAAKMREEVRERYGVDVADVARQAAERAEAVRAAEAAQPTFTVFDGSGSDGYGTAQISKSAALNWIATATDEANRYQLGPNSFQGKDPVVDWAIATRFPDRMSETNMARLREHLARETPDERAERWEAAGILARVEAERSWWESLTPEEQAEQYEPNPGFELNFFVEETRRKAIDWNSPEWQERVQAVLDTYGIGEQPTAQEAAPTPPSAPREPSAREVAARDGERYVAAFTEHLGPEQTARLTHEEAAWPALVAQLQKAERDGHDAGNLIREITVEWGRDLDDARDNAAVLQWRAERRQEKRDPENTGEAGTTTATGEQKREQEEADILSAAAAAERDTAQPEPGVETPAPEPEPIRDLLQEQLDRLADDLRNARLAEDQGRTTGQKDAAPTEPPAQEPVLVDVTPAGEPPSQPISVEDLTRGLSDAEVEDVKRQLRSLDDGELLQLANEAGLSDAEAQAMQHELRTFGDGSPGGAEPEVAPATGQPVVVDGPEWDSPERRAAEAAEMTEQGIEPDLVATRMRADVGRGAPAAEAIVGAGENSKAPTASVDRGYEQEAVVAPVIDR
jgi:hypothetical protein